MENISEKCIISCSRKSDDATVLSPSLYRDFENHFWDMTSAAHYRFTTPSVTRTIQGVPGGKVSILGGHSIGHSNQKSVYVHVSYSERFPR
jgi:hypothetical protein